MDDRARAISQAKDEANKAFDAGNASGASPELLAKWLQAYCCGEVDNERVRHRELIRGTTINHIQMARVIRQMEETMKSIDDANRKTQLLVLVLTFAALAVGLLQAFLALVQICQAK